MSTPARSVIDAAADLFLALSTLDHSPTVITLAQFNLALDLLSTTLSTIHITESIPSLLLSTSELDALDEAGVRLWNEIVRRKSECSISLLDNDQESSVISHPVVYGLESVVQAQVHINFADMHMKCGKAWLAANRSDDSEREFNLALQVSIKFCLVASLESNV
ncbi:hypothetical protein BATDEDRAFT_88412 [Batrachochytrium dendrobatidis JAM81]|uniref:Uncharacterized protein n=1 Tax=Batrachochytrium dendrobatidis (strain JAM81 / FGSC 10211) TaxID=684364 RepID=F4P1V7_BATDJ|nr:uncharacterized protein BATDEDRAFT_88412 [Batrachochytrium dendrobatidis JAM81]EGF80750.1 hypothetical protein BATDEDRAFT_88412 [Batrachochytrium dendrobatidis JAM81]|eukprot:XP_006678680.1 hypothetical protein BATDEDRAFT_88412 [Batrachochytrium dendrobatidis JAM81]